MTYVSVGSLYQVTGIYRIWASKAGASRADVSFDPGVFYLVLDVTKDFQGNVIRFTALIRGQLYEITGHWIIPPSNRKEISYLPHKTKRSLNAY